MIALGTYVKEEVPKTTVTTDDPELHPHVGKPWIRSWIASQTGAEERPRVRKSGDALLDLPIE